METISEKDFEEKVLKNKKKVLIDFFATWCGPCKMLTPILEQVQAEVKDCVIYKIDVDECMNIAKKFGIMSVPTMIIFSGGQEVERLSGLRQKSQIISALK